MFCPKELSVRVECAAGELGQRRDVPRLGEEGNSKAGEGFANPGPAAANRLWRAGKTSLQATTEETERRAGAEPPLLSPTCQHRRWQCHIPFAVFRWREGNKKEKPKTTCQGL